MSKVVVNAVGDQCPLPVVKATRALKEMKEPGVLEVHVDNEIAVQNLTRMASGYRLEAKAEKIAEKEFTVTMEVAELPEKTMPENDAVSCGADSRGDYVIAVESDCMGRGSDELGHALLKSFIFAVTQLDQLPGAILFYNGGARMTVEGSAALEDLKKLEAQGVEILTCGTCLNHYELADKLAVGSVTNMYDIVTKLTAAGKVVKP